MEPVGRRQTPNLPNRAALVDVVAVVVTYNRSKLLVECLDSLLRQSRQVERIIVVDNGSTDGTSEILKQRGFLANPTVEYLPLGKNYGNSGGIFRGINHALNEEFDWIWVMDDDANPEGHALQKIIENDLFQKNIYGSAAVGSRKGKKKFCFPARTVNRCKNKYIEYHEELNDIEEVAWIPFLGFFIHAEMIRRIGLPDPDFFILDDDVEYSERAKKHGAKIFIIKNSIIYHPYQKTVRLNILGRKVYYRSMPPWKTYYDVRNKIIIAKRYYPVLLILQTLPGILLRAFYSIFHESNRLKFLSAYVNGLISGLLNITNRRYRPPVNP
ncbi:MAG: glycosyltransferase [Thermodesulfovibrionia bacterium]|nr:glycosyltransferase [Thermodesulfovibrionia bacterium]